MGQQIRRELGFELALVEQQEENGMPHFQEKCWSGSAALYLSIRVDLGDVVSLLNVHSFENMAVVPA
jgi:hypothetical protein